MTGNGIKLLVVENFGTMRTVIVNMLKQLGYANVFEAEDGVKALSIMEKESVHLIISDWDMPNMDGIELLRRIRADGRSKNTPFLMLTSKSLKEEILEAARAGVSNYLTKPFTPKAVKEKISMILGS
jgi:two-component system chemotaxis response regulator CheY